MEDLRTIFFLLLSSLSLLGCKKSNPQEIENLPLPNILWLVSEDNSPFLGCYGDKRATTPNIDQLATQGFLYTHAYANAPVCAPARNTIITGVYANSNGGQHMRSSYPLSNTVKMYPEYLKKAGYYCTNSAKEDYNTSTKPDGLWDVSGKTAYFANRAKGQPFFHIQNIGTSHESSIFKPKSANDLKHDPAKMNLPPYHPDNEEMRHDWAYYYDNITAMDSIVGNALKELEEKGLAENTIVFYYSDHGGILGRSKRFTYESGTHVPFIVRIPEQYKHLYPAKEVNSKVNRLISFVDLAPTLLSLIGTPIPDYLQGNAFLGEQKTEDPEYAFMFRGRMDERYDMCRAVRDHKYRYIRNYMPFRKYGQHINYLWTPPSMQSWERDFLAGKCNETQSIFWNTKPVEELYDTENDPWEVNNLAQDPAYEEVVVRMRMANKEWATRIYDTGFIPEADRVARPDGQPMYDYMRSDKVPLNAIMEAAEIASLGKEENIERLQNYLTHEDSAIRYWGATGLLILREKAAPVKNDLLKLLEDDSANVVTVASELLHILGQKKAAIMGFVKVLNHSEDKARCHALNAIEVVGEDGPEIRKEIIRLLAENKKGYALRNCLWLSKQWNIKSP